MDFASHRKLCYSFFMNRIAFLIVSAFIFFFNAAPAFAAVCTDAKNFKCLEDIFARILNIALSGGAIGTFVMILMGGFSWLSSGGDPKAMEKARDQLTYGIVGLFLMVAAWFILKFIKDFTGVNVTDFKIGI